MLDADLPYAARWQRRQAALRRLRDSQRQDLRDAARELLTQHGLQGVSVGRLGMHAGMPPTTAQKLYPSVSDVALDLVVRALRALGEAVGEPAGLEPLVAGLIAAMAADAPAHRIHQATCCGFIGWHRDRLATAEALLTAIVADALTCVGVGANAAPTLLLLRDRKSVV